MKNKLLLSECKEYGKKIDDLIIQKDYAGLSSYLNQLENFANSHEQKKYAPIFYYLGTGNGILASHYQKLGEEILKINSYRKMSLFYYRKAISLLEQLDNKHNLFLSIYTNYANELEACGRVIEALKIYRKAISLNSMFGMAIGNYGRVLRRYANMVNDAGHYRDLHCYAYQAVSRALEIQDPNLHKDAYQYFKEFVEEYESLPCKEDVAQPIIFASYDIGIADEQKYRKWCLENHLFLNPMNDLIELETAFAHDPLTITQYTEFVERDNVESSSKGEPPKWFSMLNQLKEEYIYSRFLCFEGTEKTREVHYADKEVKLSLSSYDFVNYSIRLEQLKSAFKNLFSIFDQIGFAINEFWCLGFKERYADAKHIFTCEHYPKDNVALTALYWSYCEFCEKFGNADSASEGDLKTLRNAFEHKFVKVHEFSHIGKLQIENDGFYHIGENELKKQALRLLELAREWIMEFVYAIGIEDRKRDEDKDAIQLSIRDFDDEWKL